MDDAAISPETIERTYRVIEPFVRLTPALTLSGHDIRLPPCSLTLKLELMQVSGSFKARGAFAHVLTRSIPAAGVAAASGGNHGAAVAYAAMRRQIPATIFVPTVSSPAKVARIRSYGARLVVVGDRYADALAAADAWIRESGALPVHAFDDRETLLGQGTLALELARQAGALDTVLVAVGGGGLFGGIAAWYQGACQVVGVEPTDAPTLTQALGSGRPVDAPAGGIAADSLAPSRVGELMFPIAQRFATRVVLVSDHEIRAGQRALWEHFRVAAEPGGATAFAALWSGVYKPAPDERLGVVISGGNTDAVSFS